MAWRTKHILVDGFVVAVSIGLANARVIHQNSVKVGGAGAALVNVHTG